MFDIVGQSAHPRRPTTQCCAARDAGRDDPARLRGIAPARGQGAGPSRRQPEKGSAAGIVQSYAAQILNSYSDELGAEMHPTRVVARRSEQRHAPRRGPGLHEGGRIVTVVRGRYNPTLNYKHFMVPGSSSRS